jgi:hypothetical protein
MIFIPYELRPENIQILDYQHSVSESLCEPIHHSKALDELFPVIKSALLDSLIQSRISREAQYANISTERMPVGIHLSLLTFAYDLGVRRCNAYHILSLRTRLPYAYKAA